MAKISKSLSNRIDKQTGKAEIYLRFRPKSDLAFRVKSGIFIDPKLWNVKKGELKTASFGQYEITIKQKLDKLCNLIIEEYTITPIEQVTKDWLLNLIANFHLEGKPQVITPEPKVSILTETTNNNTWDIIQKFITSHTLNKRYILHYNVTLRTLQRYELFKRKRNRKYHFDINTITGEDLEDIKTYLVNEHLYFEKYPEIFKAIPESRTPGERGHNTVQAFFKRLRTCVLWCIENELITNNPFKNFKIRDSIYGTPYYITIEERNQIYNTSMESPQQEQQRDIFIFQCLIGCRVGDLLKLTKDNLINGVIEYIPHKTKDGRPVTVKVPLNNTAMEIVEKYKDMDGDKLLPFISSQKYNDYIKSIFTVSGITRKVTVINPTTGNEEKRPLNELASSHLARRTFIGNLYKQVKDPNLVGALSGHKEGSQAFVRYREIDEDMKKDLVKLLE